MGATVLESPWWGRGVYAEAGTWGGSGQKRSQVRAVGLVCHVLRDETAKFKVRSGALSLRVRLVFTLKN